MPRVSVVIPCYNQGRFVAEAIDSVLRQTWQDFEIVVVNDGSDEEESRRLLTTLKRPKTIVLHTDNQGLAAARNNGIGASSGDYILPLDADDRIGPRYLEQAVAALDNRPELGIVYCQAELFGAVEGPWTLPDFSLEAMLLDNCIFCTALFRRQDWQLSGGYDTALRYGWEDYDLWLSLIERGRQVLCLPETHFFYRVSDDSMVRARPRRHKVDSFVHIFRKHESLFGAHIDVWIERLLQTGPDGYHEAWLSGEGLERGGLNGRFVRKIEPGLRRLRFPLAGLGGLRRLCFHPADDWVLFCLLKARLEDGPEQMTPVEALPSQCQVLADCLLGSGVSSCLALTLPPAWSPEAVLLLELDYRALGRGCLSQLVGAGTSQNRNDAMAEKQPPGPTPDLPLSQVQGGKAWIKGLLRPLRNCLRQAWRRLQRESLKLGNSRSRQIVRSGLFDTAWYLRAHPAAHDSWQDPLVYYLRQGFRQDVNPHPLFDIAWYRAQYPEVGDGDPLLHYIEGGWHRANPTALFFSSWYAAHYPESTAPGWTPLRHYLEHGWRQGCRPNPLFDPTYYLATTEEARTAGIDPLEHYIYTGQCRHLRRTSPFFDEGFYLEDNPALAAAAGDIVLHMHYLQFGAAEGRSPNRLFDPLWYGEQQGCGTDDPAQAFVHYSTEGYRQGARPWRLFDPVFYAASSAEAAAAPYPLVHYLEVGVFAGQYPCGEVASLVFKPLVSVVVPTYDSDPLLLRKCIQSVLYQAYPHWELCLVDDASPAPQVREILREFAARDARVKLMLLEVNQGIAGASNQALALATGDYVAFLDHDDELTLDALYEMVRAINDTGADFLYSDEELVDQEGRYLETFAKPDWNPELLLCHNYITHLVTARLELVRRVGGLDPATSGAQDYDLALRLGEAAQCIHHVRLPLYRWRAAATSTSVHHGQKDYADAAGRRALENALARLGEAALVEAGQWRFYYRVRRPVPRPVPVSVITRIHAADPRPRLQQLLQLSPGDDVRLIALVRPDLPATLRDAAAAGDSRLRLMADPSPDCPARALHLAALEVTEGYLAFVAEDVLPCASDWLETLLEYACRPRIGVVGGRIDGNIAGLPLLSAKPDLGQDCPRYWAEFFREGSRHLHGIVCPQNVLALSFDLCMVRAELFRQLGGLAHGEFPGLLFDADFSLRVGESGLANVYTPYCRAERLAAAAAPGTEQTRQQAELARFRQRWQALLEAGDPWYNPAALWRNGHCSEADWRAWWLGGTAAAQTSGRTA